MKKITNFDFKNKKVILRLDLNVPIKDEKILSKEKINSSLKTINYISNSGGRVIILSHLGKIKELKDKEKNSLFIVYKEMLKEFNNIYFSSATHGTVLEEKINNLNNGDILLVENTRFEDLDNKKESSCDEELSKYWASLGDIFINDAFGMTHRKHASNYGISKYLPSGIGFLIEKEIKGLEPVINPIHPFVIIMGGAKVNDKLDIIKGLLPKCDYLLVGGGIANSFLACYSNVGKSLIDEDKIEDLKVLLSEYKEKIIIPTDVIVDENEHIKNLRINNLTNDSTIYDIGSETINNYAKYINDAKTIFLNGTMGLYEDDKYSSGTKEILNLVSKSSSVKIAGGGDALASIEKFNVKEFDYKSTGGGATLEYIKSGKLKCFEN